MTVTLTKKSVSTLAKALKSHSALGYMQSLDVIAEALGYQNNAALMAAVKATDCTVKQFFDDVSAAVKAADRWSALPELTASAWSDDHNIEVEIDARPYFSKVSIAQLQQLDVIEWSSDYETDDIYHEAVYAGCPEADKLATYLAAINGRTATCGFSVEIDKGEVIKWLASVNPSLLEAYAETGALGEEHDDVPAFLPEGDKAAETNELNFSPADQRSPAEILRRAEMAVRGIDRKEVKARTAVLFSMIYGDLVDKWPAEYRVETQRLAEAAMAVVTAPKNGWFDINAFICAVSLGGAWPTTALPARAGELSLADIAQQVGPDLENWLFTHPSMLTYALECQMKEGALPNETSSYLAGCEGFTWGRVFAGQTPGHDFAGRSAYCSMLLATPLRKMVTGGRVDRRYW